MTRLFLPGICGGSKVLQPAGSFVQWEAERVERRELLSPAYALVMEFEALGLERTDNFLLWSSRDISDQPPRHVLVLTSLFADNNVLFFLHPCCSILLDEEGHIKLTGKALHKNTVLQQAWFLIWSFSLTSPLCQSRWAHANGFSHT